MPLTPQAQALVELASAAFPALGTEVLDATEARRMLAARPPMTVYPIPVGWVENLVIPGNPDVPVRTYWPPSTSDAALPVVVFCHGGGWVICDLDSHDQLCRALACGSGAIVVSVDYRRAPEHRFPAAAEDAYTVVRWIADNAPTLGGDPDRIVVAGDSAGGNLAAATTVMAREQGGPHIAGQLLLYPMLDHRQNTDSYRDNAHGYFVTADHLRWYWEQYLGPDGYGSHPYASPLQIEDLSRLPAAHIITAEFDPLRDEGEAFGHRLRAAGVDARIHRYDGMFHGFVSMADHLSEATAATDEACAAIREMVSVRSAR